MTQLNMAFNAGDRESNIFDGPLALTKERDACGVGFIANTKSGGTLLLITDSLFCQLINYVDTSTDSFLFSCCSYFYIDN